MDETPLWVWTVFGVTLLLLLGIDLFAHRGHHQQSHRAAALWTIIWIAAGLLFALFVWSALGPHQGQEYLAAYLIEKSLSLDNLFVFLIVFRNLQIPPAHQRLGLSLGILGALVFRGLFVFAGVSTLRRWGWIEYVFGLILLAAAWKALRGDPSRERKNRAVRWLSKHLPVSCDLETQKFLVDEGGRRKATPLLIAVLAIEISDIVFAIDSVPAALSISRNEFVVYSSNAFAILGLRSLYLVLERTLAELRYLHYGLAAVLAFAALKMLSSHWLEIPPLVSVLIILACIGAATWASLQKTQAPHQNRRPLLRGP
jgi:tellurite resistance protein TerC